MFMCFYPCAHCVVCFWSEKLKRHIRNFKDVLTINKEFGALKSGNDLVPLTSL